MGLNLCSSDFIATPLSTPESSHSVQLPPTLRTYFLKTHLVVLDTVSEWFQQRKTRLGLGNVQWIIRSFFMHECMYARHDIHST